MVEPIVWIAGGSLAAYLLLKGEPAKKSVEDKAEELSEQVEGEVDDVVDAVTGGDVVTEGVDVNKDGMINVRDIVARVTNSVTNYDDNKDESISSAEAGELDDQQKELYDSLSKKRDCIRLYADQEIDPSTEAVYVLLETHKGWKVKHKALQEGSTVVRDYFCPPGREPLQW